MEVVFERVAGIDVGKKEVAVAVRCPGERAGQRRQVIRKFRTFWSDLLAMSAWLVEERVTHVTLESTGIYWRPVFHALCELSDVEVLLVNAAHVKNVPGRKTDAKDAEWLAQLLECGLLRGSFIPPAEIAALRDLTRYRKKLTEQRSSELQRLGKTLEDGGIKIDSVASSLTTVSARDMVEALIAGERDPRVLAGLARSSMRAKIPVLELACLGRFSAHHAVMARLHLQHMDHLAEMIAALDERIEAMTAPFEQAVQLLRTIPGIGERAAQVLLSEIGVDMDRFPSAAHLASWAGLCPGNNESAERRISGKTRHGNPVVRALLCECAWTAGRTRTYVGARFRRLHRRFGKQGGHKAAVATAHTIIEIVWHVLHEHEPYHDLGADYFEQRYDTTEARKRRAIRQLEALGLTVTVNPAA